MTSDLDPPLSLSPLSLEDLARAVEIEELASPTPWSHRVFTREYETEWSTVLGLYTPQLMGFMVFWVICDECQLLNIALHPTMRGKGLGRSLMSALFARAKKQNAASILLEVRPNNTPALGLYRACGFTEIGRRPRYYANGDDALVMRLVFDEEPCSIG